MARTPRSKALWMGMCAVAVLLLPRMSPAQLPCDKSLLQISYEADTLPQDDPSNPWFLNQSGDATATVDGGLLFVDVGSSGEITFSRYEQGLDNISATSVEARVWITDVAPDPSLSLVSLKISDGRRQAVLHFQNGGEHHLQLETDAADPPTYPIDWTVPHDYRLDLIADDAGRVYVDGVLVMEVPYSEVLVDDNSEGPWLDMTHFGGQQSTSVWDFVRYSVCADTLCEGPSARHYYGASTIPEEWPLGPWELVLNQETPPEYWSDGDLLYLNGYDVYLNSPPDVNDGYLFYRSDAALAGAKKYSLEARMHVVEGRYPEEGPPDAAYVAYGAMDDGQKMAFFITGPDPTANEILIIGAEEIFSAQCANWFTPTTYRLLVDKTSADPAQHVVEVYVDDVYCMSVPYEVLADSQGWQTGIYFGGRDSDSVWDFVAYDICQSAPTNNAPVANAGTDVVAVTGDTVHLDGTGSFDLDGDAPSFQWVQTNGPVVGLDNPLSPCPSFVAPPPAEQTDMVFSLTVDDGQLVSQADEVVVSLLLTEEGISTPPYEHQVAAIIKELPESGLVPNRRWYKRKLMSTITATSLTRDRVLSNISQLLFVNKSVNPSIEGINKPEALVYLSRIMLASFEQLHENYRSHIWLLQTEKTFNGFLPGSVPASYSFTVNVKPPSTGHNRSAELRLSASVIDLDHQKIVKEIESNVPLVDVGGRGGNRWQQQTLDLVWDGSDDGGNLVSRADYAIVGVLEVAEFDTVSGDLIRVFDQTPLFGGVFENEDWGDFIPYNTLVTSINLHIPLSMRMRWLQYSDDQSTYPFKLDDVTNALQRSNATFTVRAGLDGAEEGYVSFESRNKPGYFIYANDDKLVLEKKPGLDYPDYSSFAAGASFMLEPIDPSVFDFTVSNPESKFWIRSKSQPESYLVPDYDIGINVLPPEHDQVYYYSFPTALELSPFERLGVWAMRLCITIADVAGAGIGDSRLMVDFDSEAESRAFGGRIYLNRPERDFGRGQTRCFDITPNSEGGNSAGVSFVDDIKNINIHLTDRPSPRILGIRNVSLYVNLNEYPIFSRTWEPEPLWVPGDHPLEPITISGLRDYENLEQIDADCPLAYQDPCPHGGWRDLLTKSLDLQLVAYYFPPPHELSFDFIRNLIETQVGDTIARGLHVDGLGHFDLSWGPKEGPEYVKVTPSGSEEGVIDIDLDMSVEALGVTNEIDADASVRYSCTTVGGQSELRMVDAGSGVQLYVNPAISFLATSLAMLLEDAIVAVLGAHMAVPGFGLEGLAGWIDIGLDHAILTAGIAIMFGISHDIDRDDITTALPFCPDISLTEDAIELHWADSDYDLVPDALDNCPFVGDQSFVDSDGDEVGNVCDNCPYYWNNNQEDGDGDEVGDVCDNCPNHPNPSQADCDSDRIGDACDPIPDIPPSPVAVSPSKIVFGFGLPGETERRYVVASNTGAEGFSILEALALDLGDRVSIDLAPANPCVGGTCYEPCGPPGSRVLHPGETCGLGLTYHYAAGVGHETGRLRVVSDQAAECIGTYYGEVDVESHGNSTLMFDPVAIDFGEVAIGSRSKYRSLLLKNVGNEGIAFVASSSDPARFELTAGLISGCQLIDTLQPGESCSFRVSFVPGSQGLVLGRLIIESDVYENQDTVRLVGRGI